jgi:hypothetical protein
MAFYSYDYEPASVYGDTAIISHHTVTNMVFPRSDTPLSTIKLTEKLAEKVKRQGFPCDVMKQYRGNAPAALPQ